MRAARSVWPMSCGMCATLGPADTHTRTERCRRDKAPARGSCPMTWPAGTSALARAVVSTRRLSCSAPNLSGGTGGPWTGKVGHRDFAGPHGDTNGDDGAHQKCRGQGPADDQESSKAPHPRTKSHSQSITVLQGMEWRQGRTACVCALENGAKVTLEAVAPRAQRYEPPAVRNAASRRRWRPVA